jgi:general secretion pathway protein D
MLYGVGDAFKYRSDATTKTELVVFLRPIIVKAGTLQDDYPEFSNFLPDNNFFKNSPAATSEEKR